jgi:PAS domain S-box-containing protein
MLSMTVWSASYAVALTQTGPSRLFWERMQWLGAPLVAVLLFFFVLEYTGVGSFRPTVPVAAAFVVPVTSVVLAWTNPSHGLLWAEHEEVAAGGVVTLVQGYGPWFWVTVIYNYTLVAIGGLLLVRLLVVSEYRYLDQTVSLVVGIAAPLVGNVLSVVPLVPLPGLDVTPYAFTVTGLAFGNALFRYRLFDLLPATRQLGKQAALASLDEGVIIVGDDRTILYLNDAAADITGCDPAEVFGRSVDAVLCTDRLDFDGDDERTEVGFGDRTYEVTTAPITDRHDSTIGHTILLHDVTSRERSERTLRRQRDELGRIDRLNRVIRRINTALVGATTREEIARSVCETAVTTGDCDAAWVGIGSPPETGVVGMTADDEQPREFDSADAIPEGVSLSVPGGESNGPGPADPDASAGPGDGSAVTVPLSSGRTVYGVLSLRPGRGRRFGGRERAALEELGRTIGHAIHAVEQRQSLVGDAAIELEFRSTDDRDVLVAVSDALGPCTLDGIVPGADGTLLAYVSVAGATTEDVTAELSGLPGVADIRPVSENGSATVEVSLTGGSLCRPLVTYGANVRSAEASDGTCRLVAEVSPAADVRTVVEAVTDAYPATRLQSRREIPPPWGAGDPLAEYGFDDLTDRQEEVLEAAFRAGYFELPRDTTGEEIAESMDIAAPTLRAHLRKAENRILAAFFGE